jgi:purine-nucleoside phosphorylase
LSRTYQHQVEECVGFIAPRLETPPECGIILGTGHGLLAARLEGGGSHPYQELPHFPLATSPSHAGRLAWGRLSGKPVILCQGRFHAYEGYALRQVTFPVRVMAGLGAKGLIVTNAAGGLNPLFKPGDLMLICDHLNLMGDNPLVGKNIEAWGPRFPDLSQVYDRQWRETTEAVARHLGLGLRQGVYVAVKGPSLETPAEMSTVPEVIAAVHAGLRVLGISVISNLNLPDAMAPIAIEAIIATVAQAEPQLVELLLGILKEIS